MQTSAGWRRTARVGQTSGASLATASSRVAAAPPTPEAPTPFTPGQAAEALANLRVAETLTNTLATQAGALADAVRANLAAPPGGPHDHPWRQTGSLQASIATITDDLTAPLFSARIASNHPAAAAQELGTATIPPRPFLAPAAASLAEPIARTIGQALADLIARRLT